MACCRCNRSGRCQNCLCVKSGRACQSCLPQRLGNCVNTVRTPPSQAANTAPLSPQYSVPGSSSSSSLFSSGTLSYPSPEPMISTDNVVAASCLSITRVPETPPNSAAPEVSLDLPTFVPVM